MQDINEKTLQLTQKLAFIIKDIRINKRHLSLNTIANEYEMYKGSLSKIEKGDSNPKFLTLWKLSEALGIKLSYLIKILEDEIGEDFTLMDE